MADLHISSEAEADLDDIWLYVAKESQSVEHAPLRCLAALAQHAKRPSGDRPRVARGRAGIPLRKLCGLRLA